ncbi:hypothetical protein [Tardiphaga robiniae]|nr:hypothetical protein [Tardiphaga robiniae]
MRQLDRLIAVARRIEGGDRRMILALQGDLNTLRAVLHQRRDALAQKLNIASARSKAATTYSRIASLGRHAVATTHSITE